MTKQFLRPTEAPVAKPGLFCLFGEVRASYDHATPRPPRPLMFLLLVAAATTALLLFHYGLGLLDERVFVHCANVLVVSVILGIIWYVGELLVRKMLRDLSKID